MFRAIRTRLLALSLLVPAGASAQIMTFDYEALDGDFVLGTPTSGALSVAATSLASGGPYNSFGSVSRVVPVEGNATFQSGFFAPAGLANYVMTMNLTGITALSASATGSFTITDADGDTLSGVINGNWSRTGSSFATFDGTLTNVVLNSDDGRFNGTAGDSFDAGAPYDVPREGAIITLVTRAWFQSSFTNKNTQVDAAIVPEPATLSMLALGALAMGLRRR